MSKSLIIPNIKKHEAAHQSDDIIEGYSPLPWSYNGLFITDANGEILMDQKKPATELNANAELIVFAVNALYSGQRGG